MYGGCLNGSAKRKNCEAMSSYKSEHAGVSMGHGGSKWPGWVVMMPHGCELCNAACGE
jgi:hypothetical protein